MGWVGLGPLWQNYLKCERIVFNALKARLDKIWLHQAVKFDFMAHLTGTGNRSEGVIMPHSDTFTPQNHHLEHLAAIATPTQTGQ